MIGDWRGSEVIKLFICSTQSTLLSSVTVGECSSGDIAKSIILSRKNMKMVLELLLVLSILNKNENATPELFATYIQNYAN